MSKTQKCFGFRGTSSPDQGLCLWTLLRARTATEYQDKGEQWTAVL